MDAGTFGFDQLPLQCVVLLSQLDNLRLQFRSFLSQPVVRATVQVKNIFVLPVIFFSNRFRLPVSSPCFSVRRLRRPSEQGSLPRAIVYFHIPAPCFCPREAGIPRRVFDGNAFTRRPFPQIRDSKSNGPWVENSGGRRSRATFEITHVIGDKETVYMAIGKAKNMRKGFKNWMKSGNVKSLYANNIFWRGIGLSRELGH